MCKLDEQVNAIPFETIASKCIADSSYWYSNTPENKHDNAFEVRSTHVWVSNFSTGQVLT